MITTTHSFLSHICHESRLLIICHEPRPNIVVGKTRWWHSEFSGTHKKSYLTIGEPLTLLPSPMVIFRTRMFKKAKGNLLQAEFTKISNGPKQDDDASLTSKKRQEQNKKKGGK